MGRWKRANIICLHYFDFAYNSCIKRLNQLSRAWYYDSNAKSNAALVLQVTWKV